MVTESISNNNSSQEGTVMGIDEITNSGKDYDTEFWNKAMRGKPADFEKLKGGRTATDMFTLPYDSNRKYMAELEKEWIPSVCNKYQCIFIQQYRACVCVRRCGRVCAGRRIYQCIGSGR